MENEVLVEVDPRGRTSLAKLVPPGCYLEHTEPDGTLILEPAVVISKTQQWFIESGLADEVDRAVAQPEKYTVSQEEITRRRAARGGQGA